MKDTASSSTYEAYRDVQIKWASAEDLLLILANKLIKMKEETGMNLFWDESEEKFMRDYVENAEVFSQN